MTPVPKCAGPEGTAVPHLFEIWGTQFQNKDGRAALPRSDGSMLAME